MFGVAAHVLAHSCCMGHRFACCMPWRVCIQHAFFSLSCFLHRSGVFLWTTAMQLGYADIVAVFYYAVVVMSLSMYVMATCIFTLQDTLFQGRPGPFWAPLLLQCAAGFVCLRRSHHQPIFIRHILRLHSSAAAGHECLCACASCLCLSVCLANPILVTAASRHRQQDRFYLSSFRYIEPGCQLPISVNVWCFVRS